MNRQGLALRGLRFFWRMHVGVLIGVAIGAAVLVGALAVGDSVRLTLRDQALLRVGRVDLALMAGDRFVRTELADDLGPRLERDARVAPVLRLDGLASTPDASHRANGIAVYGVDQRFFELAPSPGAPPVLAADAVWLNERLARQLDASAGDTVILRPEQPSAMPRDMVLAANEDLSHALRVTVQGILADEAFGRFGLEANQVPPYNAFVDLAWLQRELGLAGRVNLLLVTGADETAATAALHEAWTIADIELEVEPRPDRDAADLVSRRVFIDDPVADAIGDGTGLLTYFVNELRAGDRATPYSMVCAIGPMAAVDPVDGAASPWWAALLPPDLDDEEIVINRWLADDLEAGPGDPITIRYFVLGETRRLVETSATFRVRSVVEIAGAADDRTLMPAFPGLAEADHCRDWEPGIPIDLERIRDADETYWDDHRGTPKAFVTLAAGRRLWGNRFGGLTAVRVEAGRETSTLAGLRDTLDPASVGLYFQPVRGPALASSTTSTDFGGLFLGLSFFLIASALLLIALLFAFGVEQRAGEVGTLLAIGFRPVDVRRGFLREVLPVALLGSVVGAALGLVYTRVVLLGLETVWRDAVGATSLGFHVGPGSILIGITVAFASAVLTIWLSLRRQVRRPAAALLTGRADALAPGGGSRRWRASGLVAVVCAGLALAIVVGTGVDRGAAAAGAFFGAGALLLVATVASSRVFLTRLERERRDAHLSVADLGVRNGARRASRSLAVVALVACGTFLVLAVGANRLDAQIDASSRHAGTGGFALFARSAIGVPHDLNATEGRAAFGLDDDELSDVRVVPMRVRAGDDASCLNLSLSHRPRLLGVDPEGLAERDAFTFTKTEKHAETHPWRVLDRDLLPDGDVPVIPAIGDQASLTWALHKGVGDGIDYRDERGRPFRVHVVGAVANSILQGNLLIGEHHFNTLFPSESGYRMFLIDAPVDRAATVSERLTRMMSDVGLEVTPAATRLAEFNAVQNTYLAIFQALGGLGLLLGSAGLGAVVLRNVLERRHELAVLGAIGFRTRALRWLVFSEHGLLLALGLAGGTIAAVVAVLPALRSPSADPPIGLTVGILVAVTLSGLFWVWIATAFGLRGRILDALRNE